MKELLIQGKSVHYVEYEFKSELLESHEWLKHSGQRCFTVSPLKRNVKVLNRRWHIICNYPHFSGARVANSTRVFLNDHQEQAIMMSGLNHPIWSAIYSHSGTHTNLKYYSLFQTAVFYSIYREHQQKEMSSNFFKPIIAIQGFLVQSQLDWSLKTWAEPLQTATAGCVTESRNQPSLSKV